MVQRPRPGPPGGEPEGRPIRVPTPSGPGVPVELTLAREDFARMQSIAEGLGIDLGEVIQRCIATALFIQDQVDAGAQILIRRRDGRTDELVLS
jgi:hypothetical protein